MESASQSRQADKAKPLVSIKDIAKEAGVSICTVSLVMNNKDRNRVSKAVAQRVRGTAQSMGYKPNSVARTLRTSRSYVLGFITDEIATTPHAGRVLVGAQEAARKLGYILLTVNTGNDRELENQEIAALRQYRVDGFLYAMMYHRVVEIPAELEGSPTVVVDSEDENRKIPSIYPDDEMAGYDATNRLIQAGCKRIITTVPQSPLSPRGSGSPGIAERSRTRASPSTSSWSSTWKRPQTPLRKPVACSTRSSRTASSASTMCARPSSTKRPESGRSASAQTFP